MTASHVIVEQPDYHPVILAVLGLLGIAGVFMLYTIGGWVRDRGKRSRLLDARLRQAQADARTAEAKAAKVAPPQGRHSGPQRAVPDYLPPGWEAGHDEEGYR